jgi:hypothetical protein
MFKNLKEIIFANKSKRVLEFPPTLLLLKPEDAPNDVEILKNIEKSKSANIVEGYILSYKNQNSELADLKFEFYAEININNSRFWELFVELCNLLPNEVTMLTADADTDELNYSKYTDKNKVMIFLLNYKKELTMDTFVQFGLLYHDESQLEEVFADACKYIKFWASDIGKFEKVMKKFSLKHIENLEFVDEYPKVRLSLNSIDESALTSYELLEILKNKFVN